jgi:hypothetical protein
MTKSDKQEMKEILHDYMVGVLATQQANHDIMKFQLDSIQQNVSDIKVQTTKTNGRVNELEKENISHKANCPYAEKIRTLEDSQLSISAVKKWTIKTIAITASATGIIWIALQIVGKILTKTP